MGLLLCTRCAQHPFYYEKLDINLWSIQELSYVIYHYPIMLPTELVDRKLSGWIRDELHMGILAAKLEQYMGSGEGGELQERLLLMILRESNYYTQQEISYFESEYRRLRHIDRDQFYDLLGDAYFHMGRYGRAIEAYTESLHYQDSMLVKMKLGSACVTVMQFRRASDIFEQVFVETAALEPLRKLYFISKLEPSVRTIEKYIDHIDTEMLADWELQYDNVLTQAEDSEHVRQVDDVYQRDRSEFRKKAKLWLVKWKKEYREKV